MFADGSSLHKKCSSYALTNLLFGLCRSVWVIGMLVNRPSLNPGAPAHRSTPEMLQAKERAPTLSFIVTFKLIVESIKELGGASIDVNNTNDNYFHLLLF